MQAWTSRKLSERRSHRKARGFNRFLKPTVFLLALIPLAQLIWNIVAQQLGANPVETITHHTGDWTLRFLLLALAMTPLKRLSGWNGCIRVRRMLGLFAFFYASLHLLTYLWIDQFFVWADISADVIKRPYITIGMLSFTLLIPLAVTSTDRMIRRLGGRRWRMLHRLVYPAALGGIVHFLWLVKSDYREPLIYLALFGVLLLLRVPLRMRAQCATGGFPSEPRRASSRAS